MEYTSLTPDTTFPYRLFRFAHKRALDSVSASYFAIVSKDNNPVGLILLVDIDEQWHHARSAATTFWQIFIREFNHSESRSTLTRFEEGLKELNKAIVKTQEKVKQPISVAAAIFESDQIHFSTIGTSRIILIRSGKFSDVTAGSDKSGSQFAAVTSGDISSHDAVFAVNQNFYEFIAAEPDDLWKTIDATALSKEILSRAQNSELALNCILVQYNPDDPTQTTLYWEESEKLYPINLPKFSLPALSLPKLSLPKLSLPRSLPKIKVPSATAVRSFVNTITARLKTIKPANLVIAVVVIAAITAGAIIWQKKSSLSLADQSETVSVVEEFRATESTATLDYLFNLYSSGSFSTLSAEETTQIVALAAERNIEMLANPTKIRELPNPARSVSFAGESLFAVDESGQLWQIDKTDQLKQIDHQFKIVQPQTIVALNANSLLISDQLGNIWQYRGKTNGPVALTLPTPLNTGHKLIATFNNNLYIYSQEQNAVYRQTNFTNAITTTTPYFGLSAIKNAPLTSWTINGDFIVITNKKTVVGVLRNSVTVGPITSRYSDANSRVASIDSNLIIVSDQQLLSGYNQQGKLLWQKFLPTKDPIADMAINADNLWLASGKDIYRVKL